MDEDEPLPLMPEPPPPLRRVPKPVARITRWSSSKNRTLCGACCLLVFHLGIETAPLPRTARWRVRADGRTDYLCDLHIGDYYQ